MGVLEVLFEVPSVIENGLASGTLERVGGVIRQSSGNKPIVAWLRDGAVVANENHANNPIVTILRAAQSSSLASSAQMLTALNSLNLAGQVINLGLSVVTVATITSQLDTMSKQIETLGAKILAEFEQDREMRFKSALKDAKDVFSKAKDRENAHRQAIRGLDEAREHFLANFEKTLQQAHKAEYVRLAHYYLFRAIYAEVVRIRCYLAMDDRNIAIEHLNETLPQLQAATKTLIRAWLGKGSAVYFHKDVPQSNLERFLRVQKWLYEDFHKSEFSVMLEILDDLRNQFWDENVLEDNLLRKISRTGSSVIARKEGAVIDEEQNLRLATNLLQAELLIENYERLSMFEMEIREVRLASVAIDETQLEEYGAALIVDTDVLARLQVEQ
jgi:hypothetical protein